MSNDDEIKKNKQMHPAVKDIEELFKGNLQWVVPIYQRPYVWKSATDDQIPGMWDDWLARTEELLRYGEADPHYFGAIIYSHKIKELGEIDKMELVDGQQRLTTLQVAFAALRDTGKFLKYKNIDDIESYILNKKDGNILPDEDGYKLLPSRHDREVFCKIIFPNDGRGYPAEHELTKAYNYFCKYIKDFVDKRKSEMEIETLIDALKDALLNHFRVVTIRLGEDEDPQNIFASLNGQAEPLSPFDLIRNDIFYRARGHDKKIPAEFEKKWDYFYDPFWTKKVGQALHKKARVDHFIIDVVIAQVAEEIHKNRIAAAYKKYATNPPLDSFKELDILKMYSKSYRPLQEFNGEATARIAKMLHLWGLSTMNPLVLWIDTRENKILSLDDKRTLFLMIESYIIRREICHLNTKHFNKTVPALLKKMQNQKDNIIGVLKDFLENETTDAKKMPTDKEVILACEENRIYGKISAPKLKYILKCIEESRKDDFEEDVSVNTNDLNIEHIMPQSWHEHWPLKGYGEISPEADSELVRKREQFIHTIGNLTLVTSKFNSSVKNSSWQNKKAKIKEKSRLGFNLELVKEPEWNEDKIKERSVKLANKINKIWKHPSSE